jgi:hypothetical protein
MGSLGGRGGGAMATCSRRFRQSVGQIDRVRRLARFEPVQVGSGGRFAAPGDQIRVV